MGRLKELKYFSLVMLLFLFVAAGTLSSCRDQKKKENTEIQSDHPEGEEHRADDGDEHPQKDGDEHPKKDSTDHHSNEGGEHPEG